MQTDRFWTRILPLASLLLAATGGRLAAQPAATEFSMLPFATLLQDGGEGSRILNGDHTVQAGEEVEDIVVIGGTLTIQGTVKGDAVVVGGDLLMESGGSVGGDAIVTGGQIVDHGGTVRGEMRVVDGTDAAVSGRAAQAEAEESNVAESGQKQSSEARAHRASNRGHTWFGPIRRGFNGLVSTLAFGLVLAGIGAALIFYARPYLETVSDTIRSSTVRAGAAGLAAEFLIIPAFVVLLVALAVSIIGIPLLILAAPLYPLAVAAALGMGILAVAHAIGERTAEQRHESFDLRHRNAYSYLFTGLGMLLTPLLVANLLRMTGFLGFLGTLLQIVTWMAIWVAATIGFGAVILSRAGTRRSFVAPSMDAAYDPDPLFDEPTMRGPDV